MIDTIAPFSKLSGMTHINTRLLIELIEELITLPISMIASIDMPYICANAGNRYIALNHAPNAAIQRVPDIQPMIALFLDLRL